MGRIPTHPCSFDPSQNHCPNGQHCFGADIATMAIIFEQPTLLGLQTSKRIGSCPNYHRYLELRCPVMYKSIRYWTPLKLTVLLRNWGMVLTEMAVQFALPSVQSTSTICILSLSVSPTTSTYFVRSSRIASTAQFPVNPQWINCFPQLYA